MKRLLMAAALVCAMAAPRTQKPIKVMVLFDMEGGTGVTGYEHADFAHAQEYATGRESLTADVNAAVAGLTAGGATDIMANDCRTWP
jgi:D-aminopeptidase